MITVLKSNLLTVSPESGLSFACVEHLFDEIGVLLFDIELLLLEPHILKQLIVLNHHLQLH